MLGVAKRSAKRNVPILVLLNNLQALEFLQNPACNRARALTEADGHDTTALTAAVDLLEGAETDALAQVELAGNRG